jgi:serine/arginine repetitive matrix protein 2
MPRTRGGSDDLYEDPRDEHYSYRRDDRPSSYAESSVSTTRRDRSRSRDRDEKDKKKSKDKDVKGWKRPSTRSSRSGSLSQAGGYKGDIVESPKQPTRSFSGQIATEGFSQFPGQAGAPLMSGALPAPHTPSHPGISSHVQAQFPGQDPAQYASSALPGGNPFGAAADFYQDMGQSVHHQPGVRPQPPSVIIGQDTPHLTAAAAQPNPVADTGSGAAADFYGGSTALPSSKPPRPSSMPGAFFDEEPAASKPPRPSSKPPKPVKPAKLGSAAALAGGAALGYAVGHGSSNTQQSSNYGSSNNYQSTSYANGNSNYSASTYNQGANPPYTTANGTSQIPTYSQAMEGMPPPKPPRPGKPEKQSSGSNAGLYTAAGAAGLAAYGLHHHNSHSASHDHSHNHDTSVPGSFPGENYNNGIHGSSGAYANGGMTQRHQHTGPVSRFVDWWKDYEDVQKMEEYTEYIGVCKYCFDPRSSVMDAPRKHHYGRRRSSEYMRPSGGIEKQSRYSLKEKKSHSSFSSGDERRKKTSSNAAGWVAAGLGGIGLAKAGKAVLGARRDDFDDTYSIKSGRDNRSRISGRSRSRSRDRKDYSYGRSEIRRRSRSRDRMSQMSVGFTKDKKDKKDHKVVRRHSRSRSRSSSRDRKSGFGTALGVGLAGAALGAAVNKKRRSRSRSKSPKKSIVSHRRDSSDDERRRRSQQLRRKASRSSTSGASVIDISQNHASQSGFLGGFFAAPPPKIKRKKSFTASRKKKTKGFFNFGNASSSSSSSDSEMAFGTGYVQRKRRSSPKRRPSSPKRRPSSPKRRNSDERLKATLAGLGATAAAIAAAKARRRQQGEVVAVKEHRNQRKSSDRPRPGSRYGDDEWEDLPDDDTSDSSDNAGLIYGDYDWRKGKSQESLVSNGSGTNKWGWRWGFGGQKKRRSSDNLYNDIANTSFIGPATAGAAGALTGAAIGTKLGRHDSESSSVHTLQTVYPIASNDPTTFDARRTSSVPTPQPMITSGPGTISLQQPQPIHQVPGAMYTSQAPPQSGYSVPVGPPVFSQVSGHAPYPTQYQNQTQNVIIQASQPSVHPPLPRRANSSPIQTSSWKQNAAIAGIAAAAGGAAIAAAKSHDRRTSSPSNVRFSLTKDQADKAEREFRKEQDRRDEEDRRHRDQLRREEDTRRDEEDRFRREQQLRQDEARRVEDDRRREQLHRDEEAHREEERRRHELLRQQEEARKYIEAERLAKVEAERLADERRRQQDEMRAREAREAEDMLRREHENRVQAQRVAEREAEAERIRNQRREADRIEALRLDTEARDRAERDRLEREAQEYSSRHRTDRDQRKLEQQRTGSSVSSVATDVRRKEKELEEREREVMQHDARKSTVASAVAAGAAAAITSAAISSYKDKDKGKDKDKEKEKKKEKSRDRERERRRDSSPTLHNVTPSNVKTYEPSNVSTAEPNRVKPVAPSSVVTYAPSNLQQDYADDDIFDPNLFKKSPADSTSYKKQTTRDVFQDWEERYNGPKVSQAEFFAPKELLQNDNLPKVRPVDPNEGATILTTTEAYDDSAATHTITPPYPTAYSFVATRDGRPAQQSTWGVPAFNLIAPTPPGSRAPSDRGPSEPPSPAIEPVRAPRRVPMPDEANKARSRVSWGENQFHHFEVPTPDSYREQFVSDGDVKGHNEQHARDVAIVEQESPKSGQQTATYQPYRPEQANKASEPPEIAPSTQYVRDEKESDWDNVVDASSKKSKKKESKKAKAAAAAFASGVAAMSSDDWDDRKRDTTSVISNPFSDTHAAASTIAASTVAPSTVTPSTIASSIPSSSSVYRAPSYDSASDLDLRKSLPKSTNGPGFVESEVTTEPIPMHVPGSFDEVADVTDARDQPVEEEWDASSKKSKKGKKKSKSTDDIVVAQDTPKRAEPEPIQGREPIKEVAPEPEATLSKKEKKKKSKTTKRASVDSWEESDVSPLASPTVERDPRDLEPSPPFKSAQESHTTRNISSSEKNGRNVAAAAMAGGFAALMGTSMKQDQERITSDFEHARQSFQSAEKDDSREPSSPPSNGVRQLDNGDKSFSGPSTAYDDDDLVDAKTPRRKKEKRHSSGRWSPTIGSPLRTETKYEDYMGASTNFDQRSFAEAPKVPFSSGFTSAPEPFSSRNVNDSGYHAPDEAPRKETADRDSDEFFSAGSDEREKAKAQARELERREESMTKATSKYEDDDQTTVVTVVSPQSNRDDDPRSAASPRNKHDDDLVRDERRSHRQETQPEGREQSRDRTYGLDDGEERRKRHHRRRETDDANDDWDTRSTISEARSDANGERRRKHRRRESERDGSPESVVRSRSSAASEPGDPSDDRKSSRRKSRRDDDDNASVISTSSRHDDDRSSKKEKEKRSSGLFGIFSKSKENLAESPSKSSKPREEDEEDGKRRRRKHRSDRGSTYGSDDDDTRSTISTSSRREKRSSRSERGEGERRDDYDDKVHRSSYAR